MVTSKFKIILDPYDYLMTLELSNLDQNVDRVQIEDEPDISTFNEGQKKAFDMAVQMDEEFDSLDKPYDMGCITGPAGSGKTYVISKIVHYLLHHNPSLKIATVGMTHKATNVARLMSPFLPPPNYKDIPDRDFSALSRNITRVRYSTAHSILALIPKVENRKQVWVPHPKFVDEPPLLEYDVVFVDEASMADTSMTKHFYYWSDRVLIIFVGDKEQLPPVGMKQAPVFSKAVIRDCKINMVELTEVMRQATNSPILYHATAVREGKTYPDLTENLLAQDEKSFQVYLNISERPQDVVDCLWRIFNSPQYRENTDYAKVITWRNETELKWNNLFRGLYYGDEYGTEVNGKVILPRIVPGEKLTLRAPWIKETGVGDEIVFPNSAELEVISQTVKTDTLHGTPIDYHKTRVAYMDPNTQMIKQDFIDVVTKEDQYKVEKKIRELWDLSNAAYRKGDKKEGSQLWRQKISLENRFADITYPFAATAHRAQGSTYGYAIIAEYDGKDMKKWHETRPQYKPWKYVALSRPKFGNIIILK